MGGYVTVQRFYTDVSKNRSIITEQLKNGLGGEEEEAGRND